MAISDYKTVADQNTAISGINIAEGCPPSGINNAIRQLMADIKAKDDSQDTAIGGKLSVGGGTMTGPIVQTGTIGMRCGTDASILDIYGSTQWDHGSYLALVGKDCTSRTSGMFSLGAYNGTLSTVLEGTPAGVLTWGGKYVERVDSSGSNWIRYSNGIQICFNSALYTVGDTVTYPKEFKANSLPGIVASNGSITLSAWSRTSFQVASVMGSAGNTYISWLAIGWWK